MQYDLIIQLIELIKVYEKESDNKDQDVHLFGQWLNEFHKKNGHPDFSEPDWTGKSNGRSADSVINTSLVHLYRYAILHARTAIANTSFSTPDDFIYLISLVSHGSMTKTSLIKLNVHEKSVGIQIINRLIDGGLVEQIIMQSDKRTRMIHITQKGRQRLTESMENIKQASLNVTEPLSHTEKMDLIRLLLKLENFHESKAKGVI